MKWPKKVADSIRDRSGGVCEGCGIRPASEMHHRQYASRGGKSTVENGLHLCGMGNIRSAGCHGIAHSAEGHELGWSVHSWDDPESKPVKHARYGVVYLTPTGTTNKYPPGERT